MKTKAIVLHSFRYNEADLILTLLGRHTGKISAIAKGARKPTSKMRGTVQQFNYGNYLLYKGKSLYTIAQCESEEPFAVLRQDLYKYAYASYILELIKEVMPEEYVDPDVFLLLLTALNISALKDEKLAARLFDIKLLKLLGYSPQVKCCVACGEKVGKCIDIDFSASAGGIYCKRCSKRTFDSSIYNVDVNVLAAFDYFIEKDLRIIKRIKIDPSNMKKLESFTLYYWQYILSKQLKSASFIKSLQDFA